MTNLLSQARLERLQRNDRRRVPAVRDHLRHDRRLVRRLPTVHVLFVVVWIGGGLFITVMALLAERRSDDTELAAATAGMAAFAGQKIFAPAAIVVVVMGVAMVENTAPSASTTSGSRSA